MTSTITTFTKSQARKITAELSILSEDHETQRELWDAVRSMDIEKINYFLSMGEDTRKQIRNVHQYRAGLNFGFTDVLFNEYGWLENHTWRTEEEIHIALPDDNALCNKIYLAEGLNGKWSFGLSYNHGTGSGGGYYASVFDEPIDSREQCLTLAVAELKRLHTEAIKRATNRPDPLNYNIAYMKRLVIEIDKFSASQKQLALF